MVEVVGVEGVREVRRVEEAEAVFGRAGHRDGDGAVERDDRRRLEAFELGVEVGDLGPVGVFGASGGAVEGGDGGLELVRTSAAHAEGAVDEARRPR